MTDTTVTIPNFQLQLTVQQLVDAVRQLDPEARTEVARALAQMELDADLTRLIAELYERPEVMDISDEEIQAQVSAVRERSLQDRVDLLLERLAAKPESDDLTDEEINAIVHEVRRERRGW